MNRTASGRTVYSPTDLVNFLGCAHATVLDLRDMIEPLAKDELSESDQLLFRKGNEHEATYLKQLTVDGRKITVIDKSLPLNARITQTQKAMQAGDEVIYQAALENRAWRGFADFLFRTEKTSKFGSFSYEATDTKLARRTQVKHLVQLGVYSQILSAIQGSTPDKVHIVLGDQSRESFAVNDFAAYVGHAMRCMEEFGVKPSIQSAPIPCSHCSTCRWKSHCEEQWEVDDHLSLVANIQRTQIAKLEQAGITTVAKLAALKPDTKIKELNPQVFERLRSQAELQVRKRKTNKSEFIHLERVEGRGFERLPKPNNGDLFFDMEGDPLYPKGLEYLFGVCYQENSTLVFKPFWGHNHDEEQQAFSEFMAFIGEHLQNHPDAHIYHYNHYETTALKRLAGRYAVAEHQLDDLLRKRKFVDLYQVVREAIRTTEPGYSIKNIEAFYLKREGDVKTAVDSIVVYNLWRETKDDKLLNQIADYNKVDCVSTAKLQGWLLSNRPKNAVWFSGPQALADDEAAEKKRTERLAYESQYADTQERLRKTAKKDGLGENDGRIHLADLLDFHAREARPQWWEFFDRKNHSDEDRIDDAECLGGLVQVKPPETVKRSLLHTYQFPDQETKLRAGVSVVDVDTLSAAGTIDELDEVKRIVTLKRGTAKGPLPKCLSVGPGGPIDSEVLRNAIYRVAEEILAKGPGYSAVSELLNRNPPRIRGRTASQPLASGKDFLKETTDAVAELNESYLFIQGPPGAGKTHTSAHVIIELIKRGKKVGVAANSHKAIHNLLSKIEELAERNKITFQGIKKSTGGNEETSFNGTMIQNESKTENIDLSVSLLAGTAWFFANDILDGQLDYLFIDEAGQVSVANVVAMGTAARNLVLVGDQMQLGQPIQGVHPGEAGLSVLDFLLGEQQTVAPDRGIFLGETRRLHPSICDFISRAFYEGRLKPNSENRKRKLTFSTAIKGITSEGVHFVPAKHSGCSQKCEEEGKIIRFYYEKLLGQTFTDKNGKSRAITTDDLLVVSPYNVQVNHLKSALPSGARVGTVDKFQGQEAPVVLLSMVTSDAECLPRDIDFLFSLNRLNVAISRAQCLAVVTANPRLLEVPCRTPEQLKRVNGFCQLVEYAADHTT